MRVAQRETCAERGTNRAHRSSELFTKKRGNDDEAAFACADTGCVFLSKPRSREGSTLTLSYRFLSGCRGIAYIVSDRLTRLEFNSVYTAVVTPTFANEPIFYAFFEFRDDVSRVDIAADELRAMAARLVETGRNKSVRRVTAIYAKNDQPFARALEWRDFIKTVGEVEVFRERSEALEWLRKRVAEKFRIQAEL